MTAKLIMGVVWSGSLSKQVCKAKALNYQIAQIKLAAGQFIYSITAGQRLVSKEVSSLTLVEHHEMQPLCSTKAQADWWFC